MLVLGSALVVLGTLVILRGTDIPTDQVIFEVISAFGTVGLSTGITADLPETSQLMLTLLMYVGRVGTITLAASLALGEHRMPYRTNCWLNCCFQSSFRSLKATAWWSSGWGGSAARWRAH